MTANKTQSDIRTSSVLQRKCCDVSVHINDDLHKTWLYDATGTHRDENTSFQLLDFNFMRVTDIFRTPYYMIGLLPIADSTKVTKIGLLWVYFNVKFIKVRCNFKHKYRVSECCF